MNTEQKFLIDLLVDSDKKINIPNDLNWQQLVSLAEINCLIPLFFKEIQKYSESIPSEIFSNLQEKAKDFSVQNLVFNAQLINLTRYFQAEKIEFLAYKGATMAQLAYEDSALRQFGDLDIMIRKKDFPKVKKIILENGGKYSWDLNLKQEKAVLKYHYEFPFLFGENQIPIEVHWAFMEQFFGFDPDVDKVFERSRKITIHNQEIPTLSNEDLLILLCVHGSKHFWNRLSWLCDIAKLIQIQPIDWKMVLERAKSYGCLRMLSLGLILTRDIFKIELPQDFENPEDKQINLLVQKIKNQLFENVFLPASEKTGLHLQMRERLRDKVRYSRRLFTTKLIDSLFMPMGRPQ